MGAFFFFFFFFFFCFGETIVPLIIFRSAVVPAFSLQLTNNDHMDDKRTTNRDADIVRMCFIRGAIAMGLGKTNGKVTRQSDKDIPLGLEGWVR
jgi:hypothetical protein